MKKISSVMILILLILLPVVNASQENISTSESEIRELPELDMTGMNTDIELIEIDSEIIQSTDDWIILAHDDAGKKALLEDIDRFSLSDYERSDMKTAVNDLWDTYPTKFVPAGEKTIEISVLSEGLEKTISVPVGHVTKIQFDREKIKQAAQGKQTPRTQMLATIKPSTKIVLTDNENKTIKNISSLREKLIKKCQNSGTASSSGSSSSVSDSENSFSGSNSFSSGFSSSSDISKSSGFPSSVRKSSNSTGNGLMTWSGNPGVEPHPTNLPENDYNGHNGIMYWACKNQLCGDPFTKNAADTASEPDGWAPEPETCNINWIVNAVKPFIADETWKTIIHSCNHYYDPLIGDLGSGSAPVNVKKYADMAKHNKSIAHDTDAAKQLGWASHFLTDVSLPTHTGAEPMQVLDRYYDFHPDTHRLYEGSYLTDYWNDYRLPESHKTIREIIQSNTEYYSIDNPEAATKNLARFSNSYSETLYYKIRNLPPTPLGNVSDDRALPETGFELDLTVERITENQALAAARYTSGLVRYVRNDAIKNIPIADFIVADNPICNKPYDVWFHEKTHLMPNVGSYSYKWDFGDGSSPRTSGDYDFPHHYDKDGTYTVSYKTNNSVNPSSPTEKTIDVVVGKCIPIADFAELYYPYSISFQDTSSNNPTSWMWDFGDGTAVTPENSKQNPSHTYTSISDYTVMLIASNQYGPSIKFKKLKPASEIPSARFSTDFYAGTAPANVQFNQESIGGPNLISLWDFGDGDPTNNTKDNPLHSYKKPGTFTVKLTVTNSSGSSNTLEKPGSIHVSAQDPHADFTASPTNRTDGAPLLVQFTDTSTNDPGSWFWNFGDGSTSTLQIPSHQYTANGTYTVSLTATNPDTGSKTTTKTNYITVGPLYATINGAYTILKFNSTGSTKWTPPSGVTQVDYLVVGGGGQGGIGAMYTYNGHTYFISGGGGGAGGLLNGSARPVVGIQTIVVGAGGSGSASACGAKGGDSSFGNATFTIFAHGGGGGAGGGNYCSATKNGGSGGGGTGDWFVNPNGTGIVPEGYDGGAGYLNSGLDHGDGGGGGGVAAKGSAANSTSGGDGGSGKFLDITGILVPYGGGGGGGSAMSGTTAGSGGTGCGGDGSKGYPNSAKCEGTGAGGGGTSNTARGSGSSSGAGGSGVVIIRYVTPVLPHIIPLPGYALPTDPDNDGNYEDVNGDGNLDFTDVELFFKQLDWIVENEPPAAFDYNGNNRAEFDDIVHLFKEINP